MTRYSLIQSAVSLAVMILLVIGVGCSDSIEPYIPDPHAPGSPSNPFPANGAQEQSLSLVLRWSCSDPDGDSLTYDIYFGAHYPLPLVDSLLTDTIFDPGPLSLGHTYYWMIVAHDPDGHFAIPPTWRFSTKPNYFYPLAIGNRWEYTGKSFSFNFQPDTISDFWLFDTAYLTSTIEITGIQPLPDSVYIHVFHETLVEQTLMHGDTFYTDHYFGETEKGFFYHGYSGSAGVGAAPLKLRPHGLIHFKGRVFNSIDELLALVEDGVEAFQKRYKTTMYEDGPLTSLQYPLTVGSQWTYRHQGDPWRIDKRVQDTHQVKVPAGRFECFEIQWLYDMDEDGQWDDDIIFFDYYSDVGLVKRSILFKGLIFSGYEYPDSLGTCDAKHEFLLTGYHLE
jgi:hypothetical protein